jgi:hypothetical protein
MKRALTFSIFAYLIALVFAQCAVDVVEAHGKWKAACVQIECDAQAGPDKSGTYSLPMPFIPNQSAQ